MNRSKAKSVEIISPTAGKLADLTAEIQIEHEAVIGSFKSGFHHAVRCGELLIEAKRIAGHGGWLPWLRSNPWISERAASNYMRLAANRAEIEAKSACSADLTIASALKLLSPPKSQKIDSPPASISVTPASSFGERRIKAALAAMHDCEPSERRRVFADPGIQESVQPTLIEHEGDNTDDPIDRRHRQLDDLHAAWNRADSAVRQTFLRHIVAEGAVIQENDSTAIH